MAKKRRALSLIVSIVMILAMVLSAVFIAQKAEHHCSENDCKICYQINCCLNLLNTTSPKPASVMALLSAVFSLVLFLGKEFDKYSFNSLVTLKVKLSN